MQEFDPVIYPRKVWIATGDLNEILDLFLSCGNCAPVVIEDPVNAFGVTFGNIYKADTEDVGVLI